MLPALLLASTLARAPSNADMWRNWMKTGSIYAGNPPVHRVYERKARPLLQAIEAEGARLSGVKALSGVSVHRKSS